MNSLALSRVVSRLAAVFFFAIIGSLIVRLAAAHGGGTSQLNGVTAGPFWLTVWTSPEPVRAGQLHVTVGVESGGGAPDGIVLDAVVEVLIAGRSEGGARLSGFATTEQSSNKFLYEVDFELPESGSYLVVINVSGAEGRGSTAFDLEVLPVEPSHSLGVVLVGGCVAMLGVWLVLWRRANVLV